MLPPRFQRVLRRNPGLIPAGTRTLVAVSGGPDSLALLHLLAGLQDGKPDLVAAHFDHALRPESANEARRVERWCAALDIPCRTERARGLNGGQAAYREARYDFLERVAGRSGAGRIALAHHADDQLETVLLRLSRGGASWSGLAGIPFRRGPFVRPLLPFFRVEIGAYLTALGIDALDDPGNRDPRYLRSRVRHGWLPVLAPVAAGSAKESLIGISGAAERVDRELARAAERWLEELGPVLEAEGGVQIARSHLQAYDASRQASMLRILARRLDFRLTRGGTRLGVAFISGGRSGTGVLLAEGLEFRREFDTLRLGRVRATPRDQAIRIVQVGSGQAELRLGGKRYAVKWEARRDSEGPEASAPRWHFDGPAEVLRFPLALRGVRPGDRIRLEAGSRKLKKLFNDRRVPRSERITIPVLEDADGRVRWVAGLATAHGEQDVARKRFVIGVSDVRTD